MPTSPSKTTPLPTPPGFVAVLTLALLSAQGLLLPAPAPAQCGMAMCREIPGFGMTCTVSFMNPNPLCPPMYQNGYCYNAMNLMTSYSIAMASHTPGQATPATCFWRWYVQRYSAYAGGCITVNSSTCFIDSMSDGLPVELMEFSVEPTAESEDAESGSAGTDTEPSGETDA